MKKTRSYTFYRSFILRVIFITVALLYVYLPSHQGWSGIWHELSHLTENTITNSNLGAHSHALGHNDHVHNSENLDSNHDHKVLHLIDSITKTNHKESDRSTPLVFSIDKHILPMFTTHFINRSMDLKYHHIGFRDLPHYQWDRAVPTLPPQKDFS